MEKKEIKKLVNDEIQKMCNAIVIETKKFIKQEYGFLHDMQKMVLEHKKKIEFMPIEEDLMKLIEKETRVEMKPVPPSQLDRIERMLKWLVKAQKINLYDSCQAFLLPHDKITAIHNLPDISDIIKK